MVEIKYSGSDPDSDSEPSTTAVDHGKQIIYADPTTTVATAHIQLEDPEESEAEKVPLALTDVGIGKPLHFVVDRDNQKNPISAEVVKILELSTKTHPQP